MIGSCSRIEAGGKDLREGKSIYFRGNLHQNRVDVSFATCFWFYNNMISFLIKYRFSQNIILKYNELKQGKDLTHFIESAYGPKGNNILTIGHGILFVEGIPDYL